MTQEQLIEILTQELAGLLPAAPEPAPAAAIPAAAAPPEAAPAAPPCPCKKAPPPSDALRHMQGATAARIGIGGAGPRLRTESLLDFRADHAAARDAVLQEVDEAFLQRLGLLSVRSRCRDKNEYLTRPDLGRFLDPAGEALLKERCVPSPQVQIFAAGGLSSVAVTANLENLLPVLTDALTQKGIRLGTPFYAGLARVGLEDQVAQLLGAEVVCLLIGERPGLMTAESMSAYIAYRAEPDMPESRRTVVSNIHRGGTNAVEAGAYIADLIQRILEARASGVDLQR